MPGPFELTDSEIDSQVTKTAPGTCRLGFTLTTVKRVGRSDTDVKARIKSFVGAYKCFWYEYAESEKEAFEQECSQWHFHGGPSGALDSRTHPARPAGSDWKCPKCPIFG